MTHSKANAIFPCFPSTCGAFPNSWLLSVASCCRVSYVTSPDPLRTDDVLPVVTPAEARPTLAAGLSEDVGEDPGDFLPRSFPDFSKTCQRAKDCCPQPRPSSSPVLGRSWEDSRRALTPTVSGTAIATTEAAAAAAKRSYEPRAGPKTSCEAMRVPLRETWPVRAIGSLLVAVAFSPFVLFRSRSFPLRSFPLSFPRP